MKRSASFVALLSITAACATPAPESASESESELTSSSVVACSKVRRSGDDAYVVYLSCPLPNQMAGVQLRPIDAPHARQLMELEATDRVRDPHVTGGFAWWVVRRGDGSDHFYFQRVDAPAGAPPFHVALGVSADDMDGVVFSREGAAAIVFQDRSGERFLVVHGPGHAAPTTFVLGHTSSSVYSANDGRDIVVVQFHNLPSVGLGIRRILGMRRVRINGSSVTLDAPVRSKRVVGMVERGAFNGQSFVTFAPTDERSEELVSVDAQTGDVSTLAGQLAFGRTVAITPDEVWFTARTVGGPSLLGHVRRDAPATGAASQILVSDPHEVRARLSHDGSRIVFAAGRQQEANVLGSVPSDGSGAPTIVLDRDANESVFIEGDDGDVLPSKGPRLVLRLTNQKTRGERVRLVDDRTAATLGEWQQGIDFASDFTLTGDRGAVFAKKSCGSTGSADEASAMVVQLWPSARDVTACEADPIELLSVPTARALATTSGSFPIILRTFAP